MSIAAIAIGRNEGERLIKCLASLKGASPLIYVDSGSTDGSVEAAKAVGAEVVSLDMSIPFTAARARNEGLKYLNSLDSEGEFVQFIDGDCELREGWLDTARAALEAVPKTAIVCGRRRERFPEASRWNRMIDEEWDTPIGEAIACGGDAMMRRAALAEVGGYRDDLIAGEEPEMCFRLRQKGWKIFRLDAEMTWHDAALTKVSQWWKRNKRAGHAFAESAALHGRSAERFRVAQTRSILLWSVVIPAVVASFTFFASPWALSMLGIYPVQVARMVTRGIRFERAFFIVLGKFPEAHGVLGYWRGRLIGRKSAIIEYK